MRSISIIAPGDDETALISESVTRTGNANSSLETAHWIEITWSTTAAATVPLQ